METYYDLSKRLDHESVVWPYQTPIRLEKSLTYVAHGGLTTDVHGSLHNGTHIDAPSHFAGGSMLDVDEIPLSQLCGPAVVLDMPLGEFGYVTADDLESATPSIRSGDRVILNFRWHRYLLAENLDQEKFIYKYPGLHRSAVDWLVERAVPWVGTDTPSPEHPYGSRDGLNRRRPDVITTSLLASVDEEEWPYRYAHRTLLAANIPMVEQLGGQIDEVTGKRVYVWALPPKYAAEASQIRVIARLSEEE